MRQESILQHFWPSLSFHLSLCLCFVYFWVAVLHRFYCIILSEEQTIKVQTSLHRCAGWSAPLLFACNKIKFSKVQLRDSVIPTIWINGFPNKLTFRKEPCIPEVSSPMGNDRSPEGQNNVLRNHILQCSKGGAFSSGELKTGCVLTQLYLLRIFPLRWAPTWIESVVCLHLQGRVREVEYFPLCVCKKYKCAITIHIGLVKQIFLA